jgi:hypothetical protein
LDLSNYRTVRQLTESDAVEAMISTSPDRFWALTDSLLKDGYLPTESIIVLSHGKTNVVKEGNRRIAALKLILGVFPRDKHSMPANIAEQLKKVSKGWRAANRQVPCTVYPASDAATVDRIVTLAHGKGEKAGRDQWNAVARARHNRVANTASEPALDLLEKYLDGGRNLTANQKARWAGDYQLSVLEEAMRRVAPRLGLASAKALAFAYPKITHRDGLEAILHDIGQKELGFDDIRRKEVDFGLKYGMPLGEGSTPKKGGTSDTTGKQGHGNSSANGGAAKGKAKPKALAINDPKTLKRVLKEFTPRGKNRAKVVTLKEEGERLDIGKTPLAFAFVLRSMFEISAKAYCTDHASTGGPSATKADGSDRALVDVLRDVTLHLTKNKTDKDMVKALHGAMAELAKSEGLLSVTSLNQLIHNPRFSIAPSDIAILFGNVFPLLDAMNA